MKKILIKVSNSLSSFF